ncbi:unnamed protein product [Phytomonas sp. EM1]|nr:unnamed protein product [Phytomonas sp. EM1]|eukprot:CCW65356.1 unnamed protein product [Phytomonas sp. isolate EM1]
MSMGRRETPQDIIQGSMEEPLSDVDDTDGWRNYCNKVPLAGSLPLMTVLPSSNILGSPDDTTLNSTSAGLTSPHLRTVASSIAAVMDMDASDQMEGSSPYWRNVYISGLPSHYRSNDFRALCQRFGRVEASKLCVDGSTTPTKGYGFALFYTDESAAACIQGLNNALLCGRRLQVRYADPGATPRAANGVNAMETLHPPILRERRRRPSKNVNSGTVNLPVFAPAYPDLSSLSFCPDAAIVKGTALPPSGSFTTPSAPLLVMPLGVAVLPLPLLGAESCVWMMAPPNQQANFCPPAAPAALRNPFEPGYPQRRGGSGGEDVDAL